MEIKTLQLTRTALSSAHTYGEVNSLTITGEMDGKLHIAVQGRIWYIYICICICICICAIRSYIREYIDDFMNLTILEISRKLTMDTLDLKIVVNDEELLQIRRPMERNLDPRATLMVDSCLWKVAGVVYRLNYSIHQTCSGIECNGSSWWSDLFTNTIPCMCTAVSPLSSQEQVNGWLHSLVYV